MAEVAVEGPVLSLECVNGGGDVEGVLFTCFHAIDFDVAAFLLVVRL